MTRSSSIARSTSPSASVRAALQSIIAAPVRSRSAFTSAAVTLTFRLPPFSAASAHWRLRRRPRRRGLGRGSAPRRPAARPRRRLAAGGVVRRDRTRGRRRWGRRLRRFRLAACRSRFRLRLGLRRGFLRLLGLDPRLLFLLALLALFLLLFAPLHFLGDALLLLHPPGAGALLDGAADRADHQLAGADRVVVAGDHVVDRGRVAVGVDQADDRDPQAGRLVDRDLLGFEVGDEDGVGQAVHVADAAEVELELGEFGLHPHPLLGRQQVEFALLFPAVELVQAGDPRRHRVEVGQQAAEPALVDVGHLAAVGPFLDRVAGLLLGADEEHRAAAAGELAGEAARVLQQRLGLQQVDDVDPVQLAEDEAAHVRVPATRLVAEVDSGLEQLFEACLWHGEVSLVVGEALPPPLAGTWRECRAGSGSQPTGVGF